MMYDPKIDRRHSMKRFIIAVVLATIGSTALAADSIHIFTTVDKVTTSHHKILGWNIYLDDRLPKGDKELALFKLGNILARVELPDGIWTIWRMKPNLKFYIYPNDAVFESRLPNYGPEICWDIPLYVVCKKMSSLAANTVFHTMGHKYHDMCVPNGIQNQRIKDTYDRAKLSGVYSNNLPNRDRWAHDWIDNSYLNERRDAYALSQHTEYFAELFQFYVLGWSFGHFPYDSVGGMYELDPEGYKMIRDFVDSDEAKHSKCLD